VLLSSRVLLLGLSMTMPVLLNYKVICVVQEYKNSYTVILSTSVYVMWKTRMPVGVTLLWT